MKLPHISISHSHGLALGLAAECPCGVDIQEVTGTLEKVKGRFVTPAEKNLLYACCPSSEKKGRGLGLIWSAKEAIKKASPLHPLPGFLELSLQKAEKKDGYQLEILFRKHNGKHSSIHRVFAVAYDSYTLAFTLNETKPC
jgi:4'-phosphopantetheinyl transferase EntD